MPVADYTAKDKQRRVMKRSLVRAKEYFTEWSKKTESENVEKCASLLADIKRQKRELEELTYEMVLMIEEATPAEEQKKEDELYKELEEVNYATVALCGKITAYLKKAGACNPRESIASFESTVSSAPAPDIRLPKIQIPKFDGDPRKFLKFKSLFTNLIHEDASIPNVRKLYYLQEALEGAAEEFIRDVDMTSASYTNAWLELLNRYENKRVIIRAHLTDLFEIKKIKDESGIRGLLDSVTASLRGLRSCGENPDQWSTILSFLVLSKVDDATKRDFENSVEDKKVYPPMKDLVKFLEIRASAAEERRGLSSREKPKASTNAPANKNEPTKKSYSVGTSNNPPGPKCYSCNQNHLLIRCKVFLGKTPQECYELVRKHQLCANCFGTGHKSAECRRSTCKLCQQKHHTLLHFDRPSDKPKEEPSKAKEAEVKTSAAVCSSGTVLLPTAVVRFWKQARSGFARLLSDPASEVTMVTESFVRRHRLKTKRASVIQTIEGVGKDPIVCRRACVMILQSRVGDFEMQVELLVVPTRAIKYVIHRGLIHCLQDEARDCEFAEADLPYESTDMILGAEYVESFLLNETRALGRVTLRNSRLGWLATGKVDKPSEIHPRICNSVTFRALEQHMKQLCNDEQFDLADSGTEESEQCVNHFESTYTRSPDGRFVVRLPVKGDPNQLSNTKRAAENSVRRILSKEPALVEEYHKFIREYAGMEHLRFIEYKVDESDPNFVPYYLPQLLVLRPDKTTTKIRVVFHASFKGRASESLNDILMVGPTIQLDLFDIILRFRRHKVAVAADIEKMYRQVSVDPRDRQLQKIIYQETLTSEPKVGVLNTLTYGTSPASFIATKCLFVLADLVAESNPKAADAIRKDFYMDDLLTGGDTVNEAIELNKAVRSTLLGGQFPLRKYVSNSEEFLSSLDPSLLGSEPSKILESVTTKVLGLLWVPKQDLLRVSYKPDPLPSSRIVKRQLLSEIAKVFDVLGMLAPVTIRAKLFMQQLWVQKLDWNDEIPLSMETEFRAYLESLENLNSFSVKRHYSSLHSTSTVDLVGFCDASNKAYCAVVYIRVPTGHSSFDVSFVCAKTRVAPLKPLSIPRLELQAAHLLARLLVKVESVLSERKVEKYAFSDSTTVLSWLNKPPENWKQFVANRTRDIQKAIPAANWQYIKTGENPADLATRGIAVSKLFSEASWIEGPEFLRKPLDFERNVPASTEALAEQKKSVCCAVQISPQATSLQFVENFSSYQRLIGSVAYILRFIRRHRPQQIQVTSEEREAALLAVIRVTQQQYYPAEIANLSAEAELPKRSKLLSLTPFLHNGILRVGGRLRDAKLSFELKHPIILPAKAHILLLYVRWVHKQFFHASKAFILNFINSRFWAVGNLKAVVKKVIFECVVCRRYRGETHQQIMSHLPESRVNPMPAFSNTGVDFAGPFECKCTNHRSVKTSKICVAIFVCLVTRAVHIEVVSNLTTAAFLDALKRFVSRRGLPRLILSDNGRTFVGAKNHLEKCHLDLTESGVSLWASTIGITWRFITPRAPHHGGVWEAAVKSAKYHLVRAVNHQSLSYEDYTTVFVQIEGILNSRPLSYQRECDKSIVMITPAHLAIGRALWVNVDEPSNVAHSMGARYNAIRGIVASFWHSWRTDYLAQLQVKAKWKSPSRNVSMGDVVLLREDNLLPSSWPLAIVTRVQPDLSGIVRSAEVKSNGRLYQRPITKLVALSECPP